jgi:hypothetical protein
LLYVTPEVKRYGSDTSLKLSRESGGENSRKGPWLFFICIVSLWYRGRS